VRVLIVGGTKFIGPHVVRQLVARGADVTVYHRGEHEPELPRAVCHLHGPAAAIPVLSFPEEASAPAPDVVIHMIAMGERDARAAVETFRGRTHRLVAISSGDVYQAYGRLTGAESGPPAAGLLTENSPLRTAWYPYRHAARSPDDWVQHDYEKILMERVVLGEPSLQPASCACRRSMDRRRTATSTPSMASGINLTGAGRTAMSRTSRTPSCWRRPIRQQAASTTSAKRTHRPSTNGWRTFRARRCRRQRRP